MYVLQLNNMRDSNIEILQPVARANTEEELQAFLDREKVDVYFEQNSGIKWRKSFRKGGPLEWFNPPFESDIAYHFVCVGTRDEWISEAIENASCRYDEQIMPLAEV